MYPVNPPGSAPYPMNGAPNMMPPYPTNDGGFGAPVVMGSNGPSAPYNPGFASAPPLVGGGYPPQQPTAPAPYPAFQGAGGPPSQPAPMQFAAGIPGAPMQAAGSARAGPTGAAAMPTSRVELTVSAKNLVDRDTFSKSDPVCIMYQKDLRTNQYYEIGRTEQIKNNLNPAWNTKFTMDYRFEERQVLKFAIYDWDSTSHSVEAHDYLGKLECSLGEIVAAPNNKFERNLELPPGYSGKSSQLVVHAQELGSNKEVLYIKMSAKNVDKKDFFGKSDPYVLITKKMDDGSWTNVHKTNVIKNTLNPDWAACTIRLMSLTSGKPERPLRFQVFDWNSSGQSDFIGEFQTTYCDIESKVKGGNSTFDLINPKKRDKKKSYTNSGTLIIEWIRIEEEKSFLDYIQSGVQLHFTVAIDFTASNGDPSQPNSLHYRHSQSDNQYSLAIKSVGEIIQDYDSDKLFPTLGFGARVPPSQYVSHEFFLNGNPENPYCEGVGGILQAYYHSLNTVQLYGPTYFAPVVNHVAKFAASLQDGKNYFVLLIITDGIICDMDATKEAIINASVLPMSIIIVGVGNEDFSEMEFLDSDGKLLKHNGRSAVRDIVQFVELQKYISLHGRPRNQTDTKITLAKEVLAEIPNQLVTQMRKTAGLPPLSSPAAEPMYQN